MAKKKAAAKPVEEEIDFQEDPIDFEEDFSAEPEEEGLTAGKVALGTLGAAGKVLDIPRGLTTGPLLGLLAEAITGKDIISARDWGNSINPTTLEGFPSADEIMRRAGVPKGGQLSDVAPGMYADPEKKNPWYVPEKGGLLDISTRGTGGTATDIAIDPLTYMSLGLSAAAKEAVSKTATAQALKAAEKPGFVSKILSAPGKGADKVASILTKTPATKVADLPIVGKIMEGLSDVGVSGPSRWLGKRTYDSVLLPLEHEGAKLGKKDMGEAFYKAGIKTPFGLPEKAGKAADTLVNARNKIFDRAAQGGETLNGIPGKITSMDEAMAKAREAIKKARMSDDPLKIQIADSMEDFIKKYADVDKPKVLREGTPAIPDMPDVTVSKPTGIVDEFGNPVMREEVIKGKKGRAEVPPIMSEATPVSPMKKSNMKSSLYNDIPESQFKDHIRTSQGAKIQKKMAQGLNEAAVNDVRSKLGSKAAEDVIELNKNMEPLLSTKRSQNRVANQADRTAAQIHTPTGSNVIVGSLGGKTAMLAKLIGDSARVLTMPGGYGMRKFGESTLAGPLSDAYLRQKYKELNRNEADDGEEEIDFEEE